MSDTTLSMNINLAGDLGQLQTSLQHIVDMVSLGLMGAEAVQQRPLGMPNTFFQMSPASDQVSSFEEAKSRFKVWILTSAMREFIESVSVYLEKVRFACSCFSVLKDIPSGPNATILTEDDTRILNNWMQAIPAENKKFHRLGFPDKVEKLKETYDPSIIPASISYILNLNMVRNCLVHRAGVVTVKDTNSDIGLEVDWAKVEFLLDGEIFGEGDVATSGQTLGVRYAKTTKLFALGESILLTSEEFSQICMTCTLFARDCAQGIENYWSSQGFTFSVPDQAI